MRAFDTEQVRASYLAACELDVHAFKPGNISLQSPGHGMAADDFLRSAEHSASAIARRQTTLGQRILDAVKATREFVDCNTNLGIVLLIAPLVEARYRYPDCASGEAIRKVLATTTVGDTDAVNRAIRLAKPGGLGKVAHHDVTEPATAVLIDVMREAADRDLIARQYANGFVELLHDAAPYLARALDTRETPSLAVTDLYLYLLATYPDSHVLRKHGERISTAVLASAVEVRRNFMEARDVDCQNAVLRQFDNELKQRGINPGTTADFCVAAYFFHRLQSQVNTTPGKTRTNRGAQGPTRPDCRVHL